MQYIRNIEKNNLSVFRGYSLSQNEKVIRHVINSIMCNYYVDFSEVAEYFDCPLYEIINILEYDSSNFIDFIEDGLMDIDEDKITIHKSGRLFTRNISMKFDPLMSKKIGTYSKTI